MAAGVSGGGRFVPGLVVGLLVGLPFGCMAGKAGSPPAGPPAVETATNTVTEVQPSEPTTAGGAPAAPAVTRSLWTYTKVDDEMSGKAGVVACVTSADEVHLQPPYGDVQAELCVRRSPRSGTNIFVRLLGDGQYMCTSYEGCRVHVRFDQKPAIAVPAREPSDNSSNFVFLESESKVLSGLLKADQTLFEANFYEAGEQTVHFNTRDLHWPPKAEDVKS